MAVSFTKSQRTAIDVHGRTLLISAAAGPGKTATLTERIIRELTDPECPRDISDMLIVTFAYQRRAVGRAGAESLRRTSFPSAHRRRERTHMHHRLLLS